MSTHRSAERVTSCPAPGHVVLVAACLAGNAMSKKTRTISWHEFVMEVREVPEVRNRAVQRRSVHLEMIPGQVYGEDGRVLSE